MYVFMFIAGLIIGAAMVGPDAPCRTTDICREAHARHYALVSCKGVTWSETVKYEVK